MPGFLSGGGGWSFSRVRVEEDPEFLEEELFIGIEGARKLQMECGFRPCDRDRKL